MHPAWTMAIKTKADMHPMTIHNFVADNSIPSLGLSSTGNVLETGKKQIINKKNHRFVVYVIMTFHYLFNL